MLQCLHDRPYRFENQRALVEAIGLVVLPVRQHHGDLAPEEIEGLFRARKGFVVDQAAFLAD